MKGKLVLVSRSPTLFLLLLVLLLLLRHGRCQGKIDWLRVLYTHYLFVGWNVDSSFDLRVLVCVVWNLKNGAGSSGVTVGSVEVWGVPDCADCGIGGL